MVGNILKNISILLVNDGGLYEHMSLDNGLLLKYWIVDEPEW